MQSQLVRTLPWDNLGFDLSGITNIDEALKLTHQDFEVETKPIFWEDNEHMVKNVPSKVALIRKDNQSFISEVSNKRNVIQNKDAFKIANIFLKDYGANLEKMGYRDKTTSLILSLPSETVLDDSVTPFMVINNSFSENNDGSPLSIFMSPYRMACLNQLADAASKSRRIYKSQFVIEDEQRQKQAIEDMLYIKDQRMNHLRAEAEALVGCHMDENQFLKLIEQFFPTSEESGLSNTIISHNMNKKEALIEAYGKEDLNNIRGTAWGAFNAFSDAITHMVENKESHTIDNAKKMQQVVDRIKILALVRYALMQQYGIKINLK